MQKHTNALPLTIQDFSDSFWSRFHSRIQKTESCWLWNGNKDRHGYGLIVISGHHGRQVRAHRASWVFSNGSIPEGLFILHRCDNPPCVNPDHLFLGTQADNVKDMCSKGRYVHVKFPGNHFGQKVTNDQAAKIQTLYESGKYLQYELALMFGFARSTIWRIIRHKLAYSIAS
jgi:hypothetical protein